MPVAFVTERAICTHCQLVIGLVLDHVAPEGHWVHEHNNREMCFDDEQLVAEPAPARTR